MKLAPVREVQVEALAALHAAAFDKAWPAETLAGLLAEPLVGGLAAIGDAGPAGFVLWQVLLDEAEILTVAVSPDERRQGLGRALTAAAAGFARDAGAESLFLEVGRDNPAAIALYEGLGFAQVGLRRDYYDRGAAGRADALVMRLDLNSSTASAYVQGGRSRSVDVGPD